MPDGTVKELCTNQEYHPFLFAQHQNLPYKTYESFNEAVDEFYSNLESQKYDVKCMQQVSISTLNTIFFRKFSVFITFLPEFCLAFVCKMWFMNGIL